MNQNKETTTDIRFAKTACQSPRHVRMQTIDKPATCWEFVEDCLWEMFDDPDEFVTLTIEDIKEHVRFVQAVLHEDQTIVQLGIEENDHTRLVEKICPQRECMDIFRKFYETTRVTGLEDYTPVEFYK